MSRTLLLGFIDMPGPDFLALYFILMLGAGVVSFILRQRALAPFEKRVHGIDPATVDTDILAVVRGGTSGLVATALASLVQRGHVEVTGRGEVKATDRAVGEVAGETPLSRTETAVLDYLDQVRKKAGADRTSSVAVLRDRLSVHANTIVGDAVAQGLVLPDEQRFGITMTAMLPWFVVLGLGVIKMFVGMTRNKPVSLLVLMMVLTIMAMLLFRAPKTLSATTSWLARLRLSLSPLLTAAGRSPEMLTVAETARAAAAFGVEFFAGAIGDLVEPLATVTPGHGTHLHNQSGFITSCSSGTSCSASSSCSSGSSCSSCGGGCGGCS